MEEWPCKGYNRLVRARRYGRWWMLKGLKEEYRRLQLYRTLLRKEFDILVSFQHQGVVTAVGFEETNGLGLCIVMEWVDGLTLSEWLATGERPLVQRLAVVSDLLDALEYVHGKQTVHRDLKPSNILLTNNGHHVKLIDFGLADTDNYHILKQPAGTPDFISPEQATTRQPDQRNDIFSLGCVMECLALGHRYDGIIRRCKAPINERYGSVQEVRRALDTQTVGTNMKLRLVIVVLAVAVFISVTWLYIGNREAQQPMLNPHDSQSTPAVLKDTTAARASESSAATGDTQFLLGQKSLEHYIADGKKSIDRLWVRLGVDEATDTIAKGERFYRFVGESNDFISNFPTSLSAEMTESERIVLIQSLSAYATARYVEPMLRELQAAPR